MVKRIVVGTAFVFLSISIFLLAIDIQPVTSEPTTRIVPDEFEKIQWAIGNASDGDTIFVRAGTYHENLVVDKRISLIGENKYSTIIDGGKIGIVVEIVAFSITIYNFTIQNGGSHQGIFAVSYGGNNITCNIIRNNTYGVYVRSYENTITGNTINNHTNHGIYLGSSSGNNTVYGNNVTSSTYGIRLVSSSNNTISDNRITDQELGINLRSSYNNTISGNNIADTISGIYASHSSSSNIISMNTVGNNVNGIYFDSAFGQPYNNTISGNQITNSTDGVYFSLAYNNTVSGNNITNNVYGLYLLDSYNNTVSGNDIALNNNGIFYDWHSAPNKFFHNNFIDNTWQIDPTVLDVGTQVPNSWNRSYPDGGNYWSDYAGVDLYSGPYQNETGSDEIGDTVYNVDYINNVDHYPLMKPWAFSMPWDITGPTMWVPDGKCDIRDIATVAKLFGSEVGDGRYDVRADITGPIHLEKDGKIDIRDIALVAIHFGEEYS